MRADRIVAALLFLQARGRVTAAELAEELEVSVATARRDLEAMSAAGIPVYPQPGRGGGWSLVGGARTDLSGLSADEAQALFLLLGPAVATSTAAGPTTAGPTTAAGSDITNSAAGPTAATRPGAPAATRAALRKLVRALPETFRADAEAAVGATLSDPTRWGEVDRSRPEKVELLQSAVVRRRKVRLSYTNGAGERTERLVDPWGLVDKDEVWYLLAGTDRGRRTFRVDRITEAETTGDPAERPDDFTLATAWREVVGEVEERRSRTWATVLLGSEHVRVLRDRFGRHCRVEGGTDDGRIRVRLGAPTPLDLARHLAGWGALVEVVEPPSVRTELARLGAELTRQYG
ncbi:helix-turn-helix transcriptional regulator [Kitasatospora sp. NPDC004240]